MPDAIYRYKNRCVFECRGKFQERELKSVQKYKNSNYYNKIVINFFDSLFCSVKVCLEITLNEGSLVRGEKL